jgi:hypothetical protein
MTKKPKTYTDRDRELAQKRAQKFTKLFKGEIFDDILNAAETKNEVAFKEACTGELEDSEIDWLWNYLKNMDEQKWKPTPEAAALTGW